MHRLVGKLIGIHSIFRHAPRSTPPSDSTRSNPVGQQVRCDGSGVLRIVYCLGRRRWSRHNPRPPVTALQRSRWRWWKPTNQSPGTPAQITMLIVVAELSAHIPGSLLPPPPDARCLPRLGQVENFCRCAITSTNRCNLPILYDATGKVI